MIDETQSSRSSLERFVALASIALVAALGCKRTTTFSCQFSPKGSIPPYSDLFEIEGGSVAVSPLYVDNISQTNSGTSGFNAFELNFVVEKDTTFSIRDECRLEFDSGSHSLSNRDSDPHPSFLQTEEPDKKKYKTIVWSKSTTPFPVGDGTLHLSLDINGEQHNFEIGLTISSSTETHSAVPYPPDGGKR